MLDRLGDVDGVAFWTDQLQSSVVSKGDLMMSFSESPEFVLATGTVPG